MGKKLGGAKLTVEELGSWNEVDEALRQIADCDREVAEITNELNENINKLKKKSEMQAVSFINSKNTLSAQIESFVTEHKNEIAGKTKFLNFVKVGFRKSINTTYSASKADNATPQENVSNSVFLGARMHGATSDGVTNTIVIGYNAASQGSITLGNSSITKLSCQVTAITALSDSRLKEEVSPADLSMCLDAVINLPVSRYKYKNFTGTHIDEHVTGWLADDVSAVFPKSVSVCDKIFPMLDSEGEQLYEEDGETPRTFLMEDVKEITMTEAVPTLWGAVQALTARVAALEAQLNQ